MVTAPKVEMKENLGLKMQWTGTRRPQTAVWRVPKSDLRRENYSKSAQEPGHNYDIQSPTFSSSPASSLESSIFSQVIDLNMYNGTSPGFCKISSSVPSTARKLPHIHNNTELPKGNMSMDGSSGNLHHSTTPTTQTYLTSVEIRTPWYISVLSEKERCLLRLGEEINRLSRYEAECKRKDQIISSLRSEVSQLQSDVHRDVHRDVHPLTAREEDPMDPSDPSHIDADFLAFEEFSTDVKEEKSQPASIPRGLWSGWERSASAVSMEGSLSGKEGRGQITAMEPEIDTTDDITAEDVHGRPEAAKEDEETSRRASTDQPEDESRLIRRLQEDVKTAKKEYEISKGVISSLQKSVSSHESKLRKSMTEKEALQRELRERELQIQAMSKKFSSLREERKHEELMATVEQENGGLREMMGELKSEVIRRNEMIAELKGEVQRLQREMSNYQTEVKKQEEERSHIQSRAEELAASEQHVRVALETMQTRFERFRSKIIQAAYTAPGFKGPQVEISDNEILEVMQSIRKDVDRIPPCRLYKDLLGIKKYSGINNVMGPV
ncbi:coiled-coil domain-containing protein 27 isoform X2 [Dendropsophus ebraccatus]|uniref:coiled-coil domain-containing protein 27 isoform X2 n=1 Tax=Dendropsophus ebraccatus TaxID=150705 RepID=UPI0038316AA7